MDNKLNEGVIFEDSNPVSEEDIKNTKKEIIQKSLEGGEKVNLDNVDDKTLDDLMVKLVKVDEKVECILDNCKDMDDEALAECIHRYTGMHLDESKDVLAYYRNK